MKKRNTITSIAVAVILASSLAACSDSTGDETTDVGGEPTANALTTPPSAATDEPTSESTEPPGESMDPTMELSPTESTGDGEADTITLPTNALDYADALVVAWGNGNTDQMDVLATSEVIDALGDEGGPHWDRTASDAGAGSVFVTYTNTEDGRVLELRVQNETASLGQEHAVVEARFS